MSLSRDIKGISLLDKELKCLTYVKEIIGFNLKDGSIYLEYKDQSNQIVTTSIKLNVFSQLTGDYVNNINSFDLEGDELILKYTNKQGELLDHKVNVKSDRIKSIEGFVISNNRVNLNYTDQDDVSKSTSFKLRRIREIIAFNLNNDQIVLRYINEDNVVVQKKIALNSKVSSLKDVVGLETDGSNLFFKYTDHSNQIIEESVELKYVRSIDSFTYDKATDLYKLNYVNENGVSDSVSFQIGNFIKEFSNFSELNGKITLDFKDYSDKSISKFIDLKYIKSVSKINYNPTNDTYSFTVKNQNNVNSVKSFIVERVRSITSFTEDKGQLALKYVDTSGKSVTNSVTLDYVKKLKKGFRYNTAEYEYELRYILEDGTELTTGFDIQDNYIKEITDISENNGELKITYDNHKDSIKESSVQLDYIKDIVSIGKSVNSNGEYVITLTATKANGDVINRRVPLEYTGSPMLQPYLKGVNQNLIPTGKLVKLKLFGSHFDTNTVFTFKIYIAFASGTTFRSGEVRVISDTEAEVEGYSDTSERIGIKARNGTSEEFGKAELNFVDDLKELIPNDNVLVFPLPNVVLASFNLTRKGTIAHLETPFTDDGVFFGSVTSDDDFELEFTYYAYHIETEAIISIIDSSGIRKSINNDIFSLWFGKHMALDVYVNSDKKHLLGYPADYRTKYRIYYDFSKKQIIVYKNDEVLYSSTINIAKGKDLSVKLQMVKKAQFQDLVLRGL